MTTSTRKSSATTSPTPKGPPPPGAWPNTPNSKESRSTADGPSSTPSSTSDAPSRNRPASSARAIPTRAPFGSPPTSCSTRRYRKGVAPMPPTIRLATEADADQVRRIYAPFCADDSHVSFEVEPPTVDEMRRRIARTLERHPWLVCDEG